MKPFVISDEALDRVFVKLDGFSWTDSDSARLSTLRDGFRNTYDANLMASLKKEDYFLGYGRKNGCLAYDLEWGTRELGSIKGGSKFKYGYESDFDKIKLLFNRIVAINREASYGADGSLSTELIELIKLSKEINGFKTGRTVIPKLLSIYHYDTFLPIFNDQDQILSNILVGGFEAETTGLELYLENNFKLLKVKEKLEEVTDRNFDNAEFLQLLYYTFPKEVAVPDEEILQVELQVEQKFDALEVQHYQTLLHRNFSRLFPDLRYFDDEEQRPKNGQYDTQIVGIMDMLAIDPKGNFIVIEIKRQATDKTIGQILRYMGWAQEELCKDGQEVRGIIVAERKDTQLEFALKVISNVSFMKLGLTITLESE